MKTLLLLIGLSLTASAQNTPFVHRTERKTNVQTVAASGVIAAHTVTTIAEIAYVGVATDKGVVQFDQPAIRLVSVATNLVDRAQVAKPLLSAQRPPPKVATPPAKAPVTKPAAKVPEPPKRDATTNVLTAKDITNSVSYRRAYKLPPYGTNALPR